MSNALDRLLIGVARLFEPKRRDIDAASKSQQYLRGQLRTGKFASKISNSWLIGSYARRTAIAPIDDIDILVELRPSEWRRGLFRADPAEVLKSFGSAIRYRYPDSHVRTQRRSIGLMLLRRPIDVVPALPTSESGVFLIPDRISGEWIPTAPQHHADVVTEVNQQSGGLLVPCIKLMKAWNQTLPKTAQLKSFAVETIVTRMFRSYRVGSLTSGLLNTMDFIVSCGPITGPSSLLEWPDACSISLGAYITRVPDVTGLRGNVIAGIDTEHSAKFVEKARVARDRIQRAIDNASMRKAEVEIGRVFKVEFKN